MVKDIRDKIKSLDEGLDDVRHNVIKYLLDIEDGEDIESFIKDLMQHGCVSGMVGHLIYYKDTNAFYDTYEDEIEHMLNEYADEVGIESWLEAVMNLNGSDNVGNISQQKNLLAWFGFERACEEIAREVGMEL